MAAFPGGITSLLHLNALSADLAGLLHDDGAVPPFSSRHLSSYFSARGPPPTPPRKMMPPAVPLLPARDAAARRAARQAAARRLRDARVRAYAPTHAPCTALAAATTATTTASTTATPFYSPPPPPLRPSRPSYSDAGSDSLTSSSADGEPPLVGLLRKRGRRTRLPVRRVFVLADGVLYNYRSESADRATWKLSMPGAVVGLDPRTMRIVVALDGDRTLVLYAPGVEAARVWTDALAAAADGGFGCCCDEGVVGGLSRGMGNAGNIADLASELPCNENWDSFRSFAKLQIRTRRASAPGA